ncbi:hypothetical protein [Halomonas getboli]|uniref:hypothetical protein n=1 Tax=Halomonas getboli TaxID=2935862 RepID=UPI001FFF47CF|nr:hypothetical protein [Halomonas getboli]MCK2183531.1 hypothetical protein [Halomonas getboli]
MNSPANIDDRIRLTKLQAQVMQAVTSEHQQTRRGVPMVIVQAYCNARSDCDQDRVLNALTKLRAAGLIHVKGEAVWPAPAAMDHVAPGAPLDDEPAAGPQPNTAPAADRDTRAPVRPASRDTMRPRAGGAPKPVTRPAPISVATADLKTCRLCRVTFRRPDEAPIPEDLCERCHNAREAVGWSTIPEPESIRYATRGDDLVVPSSPFYQPAGITLSLELFQRCVAMHRTLLAQAGDGYAQGEQDAGQELQWLMETGRQLVAAGGET